jgi:hypothetical protein
MNIKIEKSEFKKLYDLACDAWKTKFDERFKNFTFSDTLEFEKSFLDEMKSACNVNQLKTFNKIFEKHLVTLNPFANIKSYSDVCSVLGEDELLEKNFSFLQRERRKKALAQAKFQQIQALSWGDTIINWRDSNQRKWYNYFTVNGLGGLVDGADSCASLFTDQAAFYKTEEDAKICAKLFLSFYEDLM